MSKGSAVGVESTGPPAVSTSGAMILTLLTCKRMPAGMTLPPEFSSGMV